MGWSIGYDDKWERDIGYGVPAVCDHPECNEEIDRGLAYVCGGQPYGGDKGCGLFFCSKHRQFREFDDGEHAQVCERCADDEAEIFDAKPDVPQWIRWKLEHESWQEWRDENPAEVAALRARVSQHPTVSGGISEK
jgi:hypothetical protein